MSDTIETGLEPEYVIDAITGFEIVGSSLRVYFACQKHAHAVIQCTVVASPCDLRKIAMAIMAMVADPEAALAVQVMMAASKAH